MSALFVYTDYVHN